MDAGVARNTPESDIDIIANSCGSWVWDRTSGTVGVSTLSDDAEERKELLTAMSGESHALIHYSYKVSVGSHPSFFEKYELD